MSEQKNNTKLEVDKEERMLTTVDNPFNPFTQFNEWLAFDSQMNYNSCQLLSRIAKTSNMLSEVENAIEINRAIDEICEINASGMHVAVTRKGRTIPSNDDEAKNE